MVIIHGEFEKYCSKNNLRYKFKFEKDPTYKWSNESLFIVLCRYGYIETIKWLYSIVNIDIHSNNEEAFRGSCSSGHISIAKWLLKYSNKNKETLNIHAQNEEAFRESCGNGHISIAKWLLKYSNKNKEILNIHAQDEDAFKSSCYNGHIEVAKWIFEILKVIGEELNTNIYWNYDTILCICCKKGHIEIGKWLIEIPKNGEIINYEGKFIWSCKNGFRTSKMAS